jgi:para-aminobenzoate synthetase component 1
LNADFADCPAKELRYFDDPVAIYARLAHLDNPVLLDSGGDPERGRWDIVAAAPDPGRSLYLPADAAPLAAQQRLDAWLASARSDPAMFAAMNPTDSPGNGDKQTDTPEDTLPFYGGYIGHFGYELGRRLLDLTADTAGTLPLAAVHYYPWAVVQDRQRQRSWLVGDGSVDASQQAAVIALLDGNPTASAPQVFSLREDFVGAWTLPEYDRVFAQVKEYISAGDCYQINIGQPFSADYSGDLLCAYAALRLVARAPYSAFMPLPDGNTLLSLSPECFLSVDQRHVETRPIKGTRPRHVTPSIDQAAALALLQSDKERAENLMIVDLLRNDIGRFCEAGSVQVDTLFQLESYATVHHLVSVVSGRLQPAVSPLELLLGCLPGGSITGAPKRRAMQIIDELEPAPRQAWCGTIFYLSRHGRLDSSITIRTLYSDQQRLHCWAGGGLVDDSIARAEFQEQSDKVGAFLRTLEQLPR